MTGESSAAIMYAEATPREKLLAEALAFYADPETYFAISMLPDRPCGEFVDDFETLEGALGHPDGGKWVKPGKRAREALRACFVPSDGETA